MIPADIPKAIIRSLFARGLRVAIDVCWWEQLIEFLRIAERWEYLDADGNWIKFWRRNGNVPDEALPTRDVRT